MSAPKSRKGLGKGLGALIPPKPEKPVDVLIPDRLGKESGGLTGGSAKELLNPPANVSRETRTTSRGNRVNVSRETTDLVDVPGATLLSVAVSDVVANRAQPRNVFEQSDLDQLAESISEVGVLQPIVVRPQDHGYELIMGERRLRAAQIAGLEEIPAIVREVGDEDLLRDALLENLHRVQLNPLEEAAAYQQLLQDFGCTQEVLSAKIARSRPQIANTLRLLKLPGSVQEKVASGVLSAGHARALLGLTTQEAMEALASRIIKEGISVRTAEELVRHANGAKPTRPTKPKSEVSEVALRAADSIADRLDTSVTITEGKKKGRIVISFADQDDLQRITRLLAL